MILTQCSLDRSKHINGNKDYTLTQLLIASRWFCYFLYTLYYLQIRKPLKHLFFVCLLFFPHSLPSSLYSIPLCVFFDGKDNSPLLLLFLFLFHFKRGVFYPSHIIACYSFVKMLHSISISHLIALTHSTQFFFFRQMERV